VGTILSRLEKYGIVTHYAEGRQYVYRPLVSRREVRRFQVSELLDQFFQSNPADLVCHLIDEEKVDGEDLERIMSLIESKEKEREPQNDNR
jgi:predicted transcriptional regulator